MVECTADKARAMMKAALDNYDMNYLKSMVMNDIIVVAKRGGSKVYHLFDAEVPENAKLKLVEWLESLGYSAVLPVADKTKIRIGWDK